MNKIFIDYLIIGSFMTTLIVIGYLSSRKKVKNSNSVEGYIVGGRDTSTLLLLMSMGATYFSTWTLLGSFGAYYSSGLWFIGFAVWAIFHAFFIWIFGARIWLVGKKYGYVTPSQMIDGYYKSKRLKLLYALIGIVALVPYMLIQLTGGALVLSGLTDGHVSYEVAIVSMTLTVLIIILWAGFRGTAWSDTFMGAFFLSTMLFTFIFVLDKASWGEAFKTVAQTKPDILVVNGSTLKMLELWLSVGFGSWVLPHMWQKFYSAKSPEVLGKVTVFTPIWNSWLMAIIPMTIGILANIPGLIPGVEENPEYLLPRFFEEYFPSLSAMVVAGIMAAAISTINSQLLSSASVVSEDLFDFNNRNLSIDKKLKISKMTTIFMTLLLLLLAFIPAARGLLIPIAGIGFGIGLQLVPSALGVLHFSWITEKGAFFGLVIGIASLILFKILGISLPLLFAFFVNLLMTIVISKTDKNSIGLLELEFHNLYKRYLS